MVSRRFDPDWDPDPLVPARSAPEQRRRMPGKFSAGEGWFSLQHDLTDDELKRFVDFDVFYDPMPWFGFIPQWTLLAAIGAIVSAMIGLGRPGSCIHDPASAALGGKACAPRFKSVDQLSLVGWPGSLVSLRERGLNVMPLVVGVGYLAQRPGNRLRDLGVGQVGATTLPSGPIKTGTVWG